MKHPRIAQHVPPAAGSSIPWSDAAEKALRAKIAALWIWMWILILAGFALVIGGEIARSWPVAVTGVICWAVDVLVGQSLLKTRLELGEEMRQLPNGDFFEGSGMLANKPRTTYQLTSWQNHPSPEKVFVCRCADGRARPFSWQYDAEWIPNYDPEQFGELQPGAVDPDGGRFVILCPCGIGHYKLKA